MTNTINGITRQSGRDDNGAVRLWTTTGYVLNLSANAYDVAAWAGSNVGSP